MKGIGTHVNTAHEELEGFTREQYFLGSLIRLAFDLN